MENAKLKIECILNGISSMNYYHLANQYYLKIKRKLKQILRKTMIQIFHNPL